MRHGLQIIGKDLESLAPILREKHDINVENTITNFNILSAMDDPNPNQFCHCTQNVDHNYVLNIKKNLSQMLSREPENFDSNISVYPQGMEVRYKNNTDFILICNNSLSYALYRAKEDGRIYSFIWPRVGFIETVEKSNLGGYSIPFKGDFNWKYYYDKFINTILKEYDPSHIILLRTNATPWHIQEGVVTSFENNKYKDHRRFFKEVDDYFAEKTNCHCIDEYFSSIPPDLRTNTLTSFSVRSQKDYSLLSNTIGRIVNNPESEEFKGERRLYFNEYAHFLYKRLNKFARKKFAKPLDRLEKNWITSVSSLCDYGFDEDFCRLEMFLDKDNVLSLSDCFLDSDGILASSFGASDVALLELFTAYMSLDINDIIAIYKIYEKSQDKFYFNTIIQNILKQDDSVIARQANRFYENNINFLKKYTYISSDLPLNSNDDVLYLRLGEETFLKLAPKENIPIELIQYTVCAPTTFENVQQNGMVCPISSAQALCDDLKFYADRAKSGQGNTPIGIIFENKKAFSAALYLVDFTDILQNEYFVLRLTKESKVNTKNYTARTDLSFLLQDNVKIFHIRAGLADQLNYYLFAKYIMEDIDCDYYYDDIYNSDGRIFGENLLLKKVITEDIDDKLLSNILSKRLVISIKKISMPQSCVALYKVGFDINGIAIDPHRYKQLDGMPRMLLDFKEGLEIIKQIKSKTTYYACYRHSFYKGFDKRHICFPDFKNRKNIEVSEKMQSCDAIVMHIRRGDFVELGWAADLEFYREALEKIKNIPDYPNKHFFVFSDDIPWCKENSSGMGFDLFPDASVTYLDHNKGAESYRDMQLMTYGKIIICPFSSFSMVSAKTSDYCEIFLCSTPWIQAFYESDVRPNKYDVGPFSKTYVTKSLK